MVKALLSKLQKLWDAPTSEDQQKLRTDISQWCEQWLPEQNSLISMWNTLDLNYQQAVQTLDKARLVDANLPSDLGGSLS